MPKFRITGPDGATYDVTAPEGATEAEALAKVRAQVEGQAKPAPTPPAEAKPGGYAGFVENLPSASKTIASGLGSVANAAQAASKWAKAPYLPETQLPPAASALPAVVGAPGLAGSLARVGGATLGRALDTGSVGQSLMTGGKTAALEALFSILGPALEATRLGRNIIQKRDTANVAKAVGDISPALQTGGTAKELHALGAGAGRRALSAEQEAGVQALEKQTGLPLQAVKDEITVLQRKLKPMLPPADYDAISAQIAAKQDEIRRALTAAGGDALAKWDAMQAAYRTGKGLVGKTAPGQKAGILRRPGTWTGAESGVELNVPGLQDALRNPEVADELKTRLGQAKFDQLVNAATRGAGLGAKDRPGAVYSTGFTVSHPFFAAIARGTLPNIGAKYAHAPGQAAPLVFPPKLRAILEAASNRGGNVQP